MIKLQIVQHTVFDAQNIFEFFVEIFEIFRPGIDFDPVLFHHNATIGVVPEE